MDGGEEVTWEPKTDHTDAEKIAAFDRLHQFAMEYVTCIKRDERFKDATEYAFETLMENTVAHESGGRDFWDWKNNTPYSWEG